MSSKKKGGNIDADEELAHRLQVQELGGAAASPPGGSGPNAVPAQKTKTPLLHEDILTRVEPCDVFDVSFGTRASAGDDGGGGGGGGGGK